MRLIPTSSISASTRRRIASMKNTCVTPYARIIRANSFAPFIFSAIACLLCGLPWNLGRPLCYRKDQAQGSRVEGRGTRDEGRGTRVEGRESRVERRGSSDEGRATRVEE